MPDDPEETLVELEAEVMVLVRSSWRVPESRCCWRAASAEEELGAVVPNAHMMFGGCVGVGLGVVC